MRTKFQYPSTPLPSQLSALEPATRLQGGLSETAGQWLRVRYAVKRGHGAQHGPEGCHETSCAAEPPAHRQSCMSPSPAARRIFISHSAYDTLTAKVLRDVLGRAGVGRTFLDADDLRPGDQWIEGIREALRECDALVTLLTPEFATRPWMSAEWACFWLERKVTYVLRCEMPTRDVFQPMQASQIVDLTSVTAMTTFLDTIASDSVENFRLAELLVTRVVRARQEQAAAASEAQMERLLTSPEALSDNFVRQVVKHGSVDDLLAIHERVDDPRTNLTRVRLHQVARLLAETELAAVRLVPLTRAIGNSNYQRDVVNSVLQSHRPVSERLEFADRLFDLLTPIARQRVVAAATEAGLTLGPKWHGIAPFGL